MFFTESTVYYIENEKLIPGSLDAAGQDREKMVFGAISPEEWETLAPGLGLRRQFADGLKTSGSSRLESFESFSYISLIIPGGISSRLSCDRIGIYFGANLLLFICPDDETRFYIVTAAQDADFKKMTLAKLLYAFFEKLTENDVLLLESIEQDISLLEESLMATAKSDYVGKIIELRKRLLTLKRYYEQLFMVAQSMEENENGLINQRELRYFKILTDRIDRLLHGVINLRDYVTQVREAYQAQVDIELNGVMKLFTVITVIFLPLTLIVGWYGMNLRMPEYNWYLGYPAVILLSILVVLISIAYFKRKKWF